MSEEKIIYTKDEYAAKGWFAEREGSDAIGWGTTKTKAKADFQTDQFPRHRVEIFVNGKKLTGITVLGLINVDAKTALDILKNLNSAPGVIVDHPDLFY